MKILKIIGLIAAGISIVFIAAIITLFAGGYFGPVSLPKPYIIQSGSMEPSIKLGSLVITKPSDSYNIGDIITFTPKKGSQKLVTHRIVFRNHEGYLTAGDANEESDRWTVTEDQIVGKVLLSIPYLGYGANFAKKPQGFILLVIIPATIIVYEELRTVRREIAKLFAKLSISNDKNPIPKPAVIIPAFGAFLVVAAASGAYFFDIEKSLGNILGVAETFETPPPTINPGDIVINEIMWMGSQGDSADEWVELRNMTGSTIDLSNWVVENLGTGGGGNITIPPGSSIAANSFFLISNDPKETSVINVDPDLQDSSVSLQNNGEQLILKDNLGTTIDTANGTGDWLAGEDPPGQDPKKAMERNSTPGDGTVASNWHTATIQTNMDTEADELATPRATNSPP